MVHKNASSSSSSSTSNSSTTQDPFRVPQKNSPLLFFLFRFRLKSASYMLNLRKCLHLLFAWSYITNGLFQIWMLLIFCLVIEIFFFLRKYLDWTNGWGKVARIQRFPQGWGKRLIGRSREWEPHKKPTPLSSLQRNVIVHIDARWDTLFLWDSQRSNTTETCFHDNIFLKED